MKILTIIVSYNFVPWIDKCLGSMIRSEYPTDIMVLDNDSQDETVKIVRERYPQVKLIENRANLGFGKANNIGIQYAIKEGYDAVLLLNEDAWLDPNSLEYMVRASENHPEYGIISPIHLTGKGDKIEKGFATYTDVTDLGNRPDGNIVEVSFIDAAIWFIPLSVLKKTGLFAPIFYHYGEDKDLCNRMSYYQYKIGYIPSVFGYHDREDRETTHVRFLRSEYVYHLSEYTNVNYSFGKAFGMGVLAVVKKFIMSFFHGNGRDALSFASMAWKLLLITRKVIKAREISKHVNLKHYES
ncbi:MAG: glycosyltransferase family 2 protein [Prevotella sp.]|nr:glycosyltransferase family 2 protein [Prevotella sp.]